MAVISRFCLTIARIGSTMWVGAALLFVLTSITEQIEPEFDAVTRDRLALIRFPWYYGTGAALLLISFLTAAVACRGRTLTKIAAALLCLAGAVMVVDYAIIYRPLRARLSPPGVERTADFRQLHVWSERVNTVGFLLTVTSAVLLHISRDISDTKRD